MTKKLIQYTAQKIARNTIKVNCCEVCGKTKGQLDRHHRNIKKARKQAIKELTDEGKIDLDNTLKSEMRVVGRTMSILIIEKYAEILVKKMLQSPEIKRILKSKK